MLDITKVVVGAIRTNCYIVSDPKTKKAVVIDPGDESVKISNKISELNLTLEAVLLTHGHFDHILAADDIRQEYNVPVVVCEKEKDLIGDPGKNASAFFFEPYSGKADEFFEDGDILPYLDGKLRVITTPGHTAGSSCFYAEKEKNLFAGDTLFLDSRGRTDLPTGSEATIRASIREKLLILPENVLVYPGHGEKTTIANEKKTINDLF